MSLKPEPDPAMTAYERWELPNIGDDHDAQAKAHLPTAAELESLQQMAHQEGFAQGHGEGVEKGLADARAVIEQRLNQLDEILSKLVSPFDELDEAVVQQVSQLAMAVAKQLVRRELHSDPGQVIAVVREALQALPVSARKVEVFLHPDDAALVREAFSVGDDKSTNNLSWNILEEPLLERGGCEVRAQNSSIDARVEKRLHRIIAEVLGGERAGDQDD